MQRWVTVGIGLIVAHGCIAEEPRAAEPDIAETETEVEVDAGTDSGNRPDADLDGDLDGGPDAEPEASDGFVPECNVDEDCNVAISDVCTRWFCNDQRCTSAPDIGQACDDQDACTGDGVCDASGCQPGAAIDCTAFHPQCWTSFGDVCDTVLGCPGIAATPDEECDDGEGRDPYTCVDGWNIPADACDGVGQCVDRDAAIPSGIHPLAGDWFAVMQSTPQDDRTDAVARFAMELRQNGAVDIGPVSSNDGDWKSSLESTSGRYCADADGRLTWSGDEDVIAATADASRSLMLLRSDTRRAIGLAIRPSGSPAAVDGRYRLVTTSQQAFEFRSLTSRTGHVEFDHGCLTGTGRVESAGSGLAIDIVPVDASCLTAVGDNVGMEVGYRLANNTISQTWYGAIGLGGDLLVLVAGDLNRTYFGLVILMRDRGDAPVPALPGSWSFGLHRGGYNGENVTVIPTFTHGALELGTDFTSIAGYVFGDDGGPVLGGWWFTHLDGRYAQRATLGSSVVHLAGAVTRGDSLVVGWVTDAPAAINTPQALSAAPREGSLFLAVKNAPLY